MTQQTIGHRVNPSEEIIHVGPLVVRFLLTGDNSTGSIAAFELTVPAAQSLPAPAHSHDHYEEAIYGIDGVLTWTVDGQQIRRRARPGALHSARRRSPVRQPWKPGREGALRNHAGGNWPAVFPRDCRSDQRSGWWSAGPSKDGGDHAPAWPHACPGSSVDEGTHQNEREWPERL